MSAKIGEFTDELGYGVFPSIPGRKAPLIQDARNVVFDEAGLKSSLGQSSLFGSPQSAPTVGILQTLIDGVPTVFWGTPTKLWRWDAINDVEELTNTTPYTGTSSDLWVFGRWGNWVVATNGVDPIQVWKNTGLFIDLPGQPFAWAKTIVATNTQLVAYNTDNDVAESVWTDIDDIENWTPTAANQAGDLPFRNTDSSITNAIQFGDNIVFFTNNELYRMTYSGAGLVFESKKLLEGIGVKGVSAVCQADGKLFGMGARGIWLSDGGQYKYIDTPTIRDFIYKNPATRINTSRFSSIVAFHDILQKMVTFFYATEAGLGQNDIGIGYHYEKGQFTILDYGRTCASDSAVFDFAVTGDSLGNIFAQSFLDSGVVSGNDIGVLNLTNTSCNLALGFGEGGFGELGFGGEDDITG